ncbi:MAG: DUF262 domain-containing protein [Stellaceae bacterium]
MEVEADNAPGDLGEMEEEEGFTFPPAERRVVTQPVDLSVQTLIEQWAEQLLVLPEMQREYVWDNGKASRLIESLILNIPIPVVYFSENQEAKYEIVDGHQRVRSIVRYLNNEFALSGIAVLREYKGLRFHQLPEREQRFLRMRTLRAILILVDSHPNMRFEIYERLNTGAILLNAQELRNSIYRGPFNDLLHSLAKASDFRSLMRTKAPRRRMIDEELILRFFSLYFGLGQYRTPLKRFLNEFMRTSKNLNNADLTQFRSVFEKAVATAGCLFGEWAFRMTDKDGHTIEPVVNRALFDAQMLASVWTETDLKHIDPSRVRNEVSALFSDETFLDAIQRATGDRARTLKRIRETVTALTKAGLTIGVPYDLSR